MPPCKIKQIVQSLLKGLTYSIVMLEENKMAEPQTKPEEEETLEEAKAAEQRAWNQRQFHRSRGKFGSED